MNKKLIKEIKDFLEDYDLGWYKECYTISKETFLRKMSNKNSNET